MNSDIEFDLVELAYRSSKVQWLFLIAIFTLLQTVGYWCYLAPKLSVLESAQQQEKSITERLQSQASVVSTISRLRAELNQSLEQETQLEKTLVNPGELSSLLEAINQIGASHRIVFDHLAWGQSQPAQYFYLLPLQLELRGGYHDIAHFAGRLALLPALIHFAEFTIERVEPESEELYLRVRANLYQTQLAGVSNEG